MPSIAVLPVRPRFPRLPFSRLRGGEPLRRGWHPLQPRGQVQELALRAASLERARILQDLHDGCGGQLVLALRMACDEAASERIAEVLRDCIDDLRITLDGCDDCGSDLGPLLAAQRDRMEARLAGGPLRLEWDLDLGCDLVPLSRDHGLHVLRIIQEAFTNVVKHSRAGLIRVAGAVEGQERRELRLSIRDDGVGIRHPRTGRGIGNMRRRAALIGAMLAWQPADPQTGTGTEVELRVPLQSD